MKARIASRIASAISRSRVTATPPLAHPAPVAVSPTERHYTPAEVAAMWAISLNTVRDIFRAQPGVFVPTRGRGRYVTMRIPESVLARVHRERVQ